MPRLPSQALSLLFAVPMIAPALLAENAAQLTHLSTAVFAATGNRLPNLSEKNPKPRFAVKGITWPANPGDAEICLWKDDKIAPMSFTVDDNSAPDVPWWLDMADRHGFRVTWFIISNNVKGGYGGDWALWKNVLAKGHDVQSHTHTHLRGSDTSEWPGIDWEYAESKRVIEENLPGHRVRFLAYPGGARPDPNDRNVAARRYAGARSGTGTLVSPASMDYFATRAIVEGSLGNPKSAWADFTRALDPADKLYRAWGIYIYHRVKDKTPERAIFRFIDENKDVLWLSLYGETSLYAQQRDTATLTAREKGGERIVLSLTDRLDDATFDYPLTIKVRLPADWRNVTAQQAGKPAAVRVVEHEGARYALVGVVPDRGDAVLAPVR